MSQKVTAKNTSTPLKTSKPDSEDALEFATIACFESLGEWQHVNAFHETYGPNGTLGRETANETVLTRPLVAALQKLNSDLPASALQEAIEELTRDRSAMSAANANRETMQLLRDGVPVRFKIEDGEDEDGGAEGESTVRVLDWNDAANNDFLLVQQLWVTGEMYSRRADLVGFVNGLPLVFVELKAAHKNVEDAFYNNLRDYKDTIPHLFAHNVLMILSNGIDSRVGSLTADWEHFVEWKKISSEEEAGVISLETTIRGTCEPSRLLDLAENFTVFQETSGGLIKMLAKNHQFLGVNNAIEAVRDIEGNQGKLGVFWHTQGSGKSLSMVFFAQKVLRKMPGDWTFLILTDRDDLDGQIYKNFATCGVVTESEKDISAQNGKHLQQLLGENHRYVFTLIQKFHTERGASYPMLSDRSNVIVMTDEAHRSQYDIFARNMRAALPNAAFIGFTGTPLIDGQETKTKEVFGDYVSVYSFSDAIADRATVPLFYDNRIPELQLTNDDLNEQMQQLIEDAALDEEQEKALEREFKREYHLITREDRLDEIAADLVSHFMGRGRLDKAMVLSIDKATAVRMFDKVKKHWANHCAGLREKMMVAATQEREALAAQIAFMEETDMAVVVSSGQNEVNDFKKKGLDIAPHRKRMVSEDLETKFKDPKDPFRIVFVCAMWIVGFDVPCCSTIYLDKPMRNHSLMQAIARANRIFGDKTNGLIVDYIGVFRDLQRALSIYAISTNQDDEKPIRPKSELVEALAVAADEANTFCIEHNISLSAIGSAEGFARIKLKDDAREAILESEETKKQFMAYSARVDRLFKAVLPDAEADLFKPTRTTLMVLAESVRAFTPQADISDVMAQVDQLLDKSVAAEAYQIQPGGQRDLTDLSTIDFEALQASFATGHKRTETEKLKGALNAKLKNMVRLNRTRMDYLEKFEQMIEDYNAGSCNVEQLFGQLVQLTHNLQEEEKRHISEALSEEELAVFDLLTKPALKLSEAEKKQVKIVARELLETLKREQLVLDWRKGQQSRAAVRLQIEQTLDTLPERYDKSAYEQKVETVYQHIYDSYFGLNRSVYSSVL